MILHHIRHLPEDAAYTAIMASKVQQGEVEPPELPAEEIARIDATVWNTDRKLLAQVVNAINLNTRISGQWQDGKPPDFPIVGPASWRDEKQSKPEEKKVSVLDVMKAWGYDGGV